MVTDSVIQLPTEVWQHIVQLGVERRVQELEVRLEEARRRIAEYERRFGMSFVDLEQEGLPENADLHVHEAYVEWSSWEGLQADLQEQLETLKAVSGSIDCTEAKMSEDGSLTLEVGPFFGGDEVEIVVRARRQVRAGKRYALRDKPVRYHAPFKGVDEDEWEALQ
jgi:hypothetical protein